MCWIRDEIMTNECDCNTIVASNPTMLSLSSFNADFANFRPQKELMYNKLLPYASELDAESRVRLAEIKGNLGRAVMLRELMPGCVFWTTRLNLWAMESRSWKLQRSFLVYRVLKKWKNRLGLRGQITLILD